MTAISAVLLLGCKKEPKPTLDNHSFAAGVWCAQMAYKNGVRFTTNYYNQEGGWFSPSGLNHGEILHWCRHHAITNGWGKFNNRDGFHGDEGLASANTPKLSDIPWHTITNWDRFDVHYDRTNKAGAIKMTKWTILWRDGSKETWEAW